MFHRTLAAFAALVSVITLLPQSAHATNPANRWEDRITLNAAGKYTVTPGTWTMNGIPIGQTWIGGGTVTGPGTASNFIRFPAGIVPNDFHYFGDTFVTPGGVTTFYIGDFYWGSYFAPLEIPLYAQQVGLDTNLSMTLDWIISPSDPHMQLAKNGVPIYLGPLSGFNPSMHNLMLVGVRPLSHTPPHQTFCFGDGSGTSCPCGNNSAPGSGEGCVNSHGLGGMLVATGDASVAGDTLVLQGSQMPPTSSVLYFQGTLPVGGGSGNVFGDGLRCAGGSVIRFDTQTNVGGASQYPSGGSPLISVKGMVVPGSTYVYQAWYRDSAAYCMPSGFNLTNAVSATWTP